MNHTKTSPLARTSLQSLWADTDAQPILGCTAFQAPIQIGMDLHSNNVVVVVRTTELTAQGIRPVNLLVKKFPILNAADRAKLVEELAPYCSQPHTVAVVESTYNWYWLADLFECRGWDLRIADPCTVSKAQLKFSDDYTDAEYLAECMRNGSLKSYSIMHKDLRAIRDLARFRQDYVEKRAAAKTTIINYFSNQLGDRIRANWLVSRAYQCLENDQPITLELFAEWLELDTQQMKVKWLVKEIIFCDEAIADIDKMLQEKAPSNPVVRALRTIKGCGEVLSVLIGLEIGQDMDRFENAKKFVSYCRLAPTSKLSNGKSKGSGNAKNGNAYLSWAFTELANFVIRFNPEAKAFYDRHFKRTNLRVVSIRTVAAKLARAIFHTLKTGETFDMKRCFNG